MTARRKSSSQPALLGNDTDPASIRAGHADRIDIMLDQGQVCQCLDETAKQTEPSEKTPSEANRQVTTVSIPARLKRTGKEMRIIVDDGSEPAIPDTGLGRLLVRANALRDQPLADR